MKLASNMGILVLATAIILLSFLYSFVTEVNSVYAAQSGGGLSEALSHTCGEGLIVPCSHICQFIAGSDCPPRP